LCFAWQRLDAGIGDYTYVELPVRASWESPLLRTGVASDYVLTSSLGRGGELRVQLDLGSLPDDLEPESIVRANTEAALSVLLSSAGHALFEIYMVMWSYDPGTGEWPDLPG